MKAHTARKRKKPPPRIWALFGARRTLRTRWVAARLHAAVRSANARSSTRPAAHVQGGRWARSPNDAPKSGAMKTSARGSACEATVEATRRRKGETGKARYRETSLWSSTPAESKGQAHQTQKVTKQSSSRRKM